MTDEERIACGWDWNSEPCSEEATHFYLNIEGKLQARCHIHYPSTGLLTVDLTRQEYEVYLVMQA